MIVDFLLLIVGVYYFIKTKSIERWFLVIGPLISFSLGIFNLYFLPNWNFGNKSVESFLSNMSLIQLFGEVIFSIGFIILVIKHLKIK